MSTNEFAFAEKILVVITLYQMELRESPAYNSLLSQNRSLTFFIYNNSPQPTTNFSRNESLIIEHHPENRGVSAAFNRGAEVAQNLNKHWLLLADQDTTFPSGIIKLYAQAADQFEVITPLIIDQKGIISPFIFRYGKGWRISTPPLGEQMLSHFQFINSGLLISKELFQRTQGFDENYPLDFSDLIFIRKLAVEKKHFFVINEKCTHQLSSEQNSEHEALSRFRIYTAAANRFSKQTCNAAVRVMIYARALRLLFRFWNPNFLLTAIKIIRG